MPNIKNLTCVHRKNCILANIRKIFIYFGKKMIFIHKQRNILNTCCCGFELRCKRQEMYDKYTKK